jgi:hypothetical protein
MTPKESSILRKAIVRLLHKRVKGRLSKKEQERLNVWLTQNEKNPILLQEITNDKTLTSELTDFSGFDWDRFSQKLEAKGFPISEDYQSRPLIHWGRYLVAAAAVILGVFTTYLLIEKKEKPPDKRSEPVVAKKQDDVPPGKFKARLILDGGKTIILDSVAPGTLTNQGKTKVLNKNGHLVYDAGSYDQTVNLSPAINTLTTSKAETYMLELADGSKVWLNSGSSIRFPVAFPGKERRVEVTGEVFFEVTHNADQPFIVKVGSSEVQVLGTTFNINAYEDEDAIKTTLLTGKVRIVNHATGREQSAVLAPGQQAQILGANIKLVSDVDTEQVQAWRQGLFQFNKADIKTIMRQIARWYDVEVTYEGNFSNKEFWGKISRDLNASEVLGVLQKYGVHFRIEGKKIVVTP